MRLRRAALWALVALGGLLVLAELTLQIGSLFVKDRLRFAPDGHHIVILSVGDSHTYGAGIPSEESYPAYLQAFLDARAPNRYWVVNAGVPGMNTSQVWRRLPTWTSRYSPAVILVWCGINNAWNKADAAAGGGALLSTLDGLATRSRLYRTLRVWSHDRRLERSLSAAPSHQAHEIQIEGLLGSAQVMSLHAAGRVERVPIDIDGSKVDEAMKEQARRDYEAMVQFARSAGIRIGFITYPNKASGVFAAANVVIREIARRHGLLMIESRESAARVPADKRKFIWAGHPTGPIYREIARDVADALVPPAP